jgi:transposase-like protein
VSDQQADKRKRRSFTRDFTLAALARMKQTDTIVGLAHELGLERKLLYCWREKYESGGAEGLRRAGRPAATTLAERADPADPAVATVPDAQARIAELEQTIGRQQMALDFFRAALQQVRDLRRSNGEPGAKASTP